MRAIFLLIALVYSQFVLSAKDLSTVCYFRLSMNDCITHFRSISYCNKLSAYNAFFLVQNEVKDNIQDIIDYKLPPEALLPFVVSDSLYNALGHSNFSSFHVLKNGKEIFYCSLSELPSKFNVVLNILTSNFDSLNLGFKLPLPYRYETIYSGSKLFIYDRTFYRITIIDLVSGQILKLSNTEQMSNLNYHLNLDSNEVERNFRYLESAKVSPKGRIEDIYCDNDTLFYILQNNYATDTIIENIKDTLIGSVFCLVKFFDSEMSILPIRNIYHNDGYSFGQYSFFINKGIPYFAMANDDIHSKDLKFLAKWKIVDKGCGFDRLLPFVLPEIHRENDLRYSFSDFEMKWPYLMNSISNELYNLENSEIKKLPLDVAKSDFSGIKQYKVKVNFSIADLIYDHDTLNILALNDGTFFIYKIQISKNKLLSKKLLNEKMNSSDYANKPKFKDFNTVYYFKPESNFLYFKTVN